MGETYPSDDDGCGVCICATAEFENKLLDGGVDEYAEAATDDSSTWALPQRMEERCLRYLHSLSTGQDTFFIEANEGDEKKREKMIDDTELEKKEIELENLVATMEATEEDQQRARQELSELTEKCEALETIWKSATTAVDDLMQEKKEKGWSKEFQSRLKPAKKQRNVSLKSFQECFSSSPSDAASPSPIPSPRLAQSASRCCRLNSGAAASAAAAAASDAAESHSASRTPLGFSSTKRPR